MPAIRYKSCTIEGSNADAILAFKEAMAESAVALQDELIQLESLQTTRRDNSVVLTGLDASALQRHPVDRTVIDPGTLTPVVTDSPLVTSLPGQQGVHFRSKPLINNMGALRDTHETALAQWEFSETSGDTVSAQESLADAALRLRTAVLHGTSAQTNDGPLGTSRTLTTGTYYTVHTGMGVFGVSPSMVDMRGPMTVWGWARLDDHATEHTLVSFSSPPTHQVVGTVVVQNGSDAVVGTGTNFSVLRVGTSVQFGTGFTSIIAHIDSDTSLTLMGPYTLPTATTTMSLSGISGTVAVTNGSTTVTGTGTTFTYLQTHDRVVLPDGRLYEIMAIGGPTSMTIAPPYQGTSGTGGSWWRGSPFQPQSRNTLYGLNVGTDGTLQYRVQHHQRMTETVHTGLTVPLGDYFFASMERRSLGRGTVVVWRDAPNNVTRVRGAGFSSANVGEYLNFSGLDGWWVVVAYDVPTGDLIVQNPMTAPVDDPSSFGASFTNLARALETPRAARTTETVVSLGKLDGTFQQYTKVGLPFPDGGVEPGPMLAGAQLPDSISNLYIGHDAERSLHWNGSVDIVSLYGAAFAKGPVQHHGITYPSEVEFHFTRAFPDYTRPAVNTIARSTRTDIPGGSTVWCTYDYITGITDSLVTTSELDNSASGMLAQMSNPSATSLSGLAVSVGTPDPNDISTAALQKSLQRYGLIVADGQPLIRGTTNMSAYAVLANLVGGTAAANALIANKVDGSFVLVAVVEELHEESSIDSCGVSIPKTVVIERVVGINRNLTEAALSAGLTTTDTLKLKMFWLGRVGRDNGTLAKMRWLGMQETQIALSTALQGDQTITTYLIANQNAGVSTGIPPATLDNMLAGLQVIPINATPTPAQVNQAIQIILTSPSGLTIDGAQRADDPSLLVAATVDLNKALLFDDLIEAPFSAVDPACQALMAILEDLIRMVQRLLANVNRALVPFAIKQRRSFGTQKLAFTQYIPCLGNVSASFGAPPFKFEVHKSITLLDLAREQAAVVNRQAEKAVDRFRDALCLPRTLVAALRGGVCGIEQPKILANQKCPTQLDLLMERLQQLLDTIDLMLRQLLKSLSTFELDIELSGGAASQIAADFSVPCIGTVANFIVRLG